MPIPLRQNVRIGAHLVRHRLKKTKYYPFIVEIEPLFACNLACPGCGKIQHPTEILRQRLSVEDVLGAVSESGTPMVSIAGGEPLLHPDIERMVRELVRRKVYVYLCTNAVLLNRRLDRFTPSHYFSWVVHLDGLRERHDAAVDRAGVFDTAVAAIREAKAKGFRVTTNSTFFNTDSPKTVRDVLDFLNDDLGVDAMMISPAYAYGKAPDQEHFLGVEQTRQLFKEAFGDKRRKKWRLNHSPLFLDFLEGKVDFQCTAWGIPSYSVFGWQRPCYLMADGYAASYRELIETTDWSAYGRGKDPRCENCMAHCGYEPTAVIASLGSLRQSLRALDEYALNAMSVITVPAESLLATAVSPECLREMSPRELRSLVGEIRRFLISSVSATGGHLGSNLGVVELTVALHRVFSSPDDAIVWDTGHQAYVHKLVTGRKEAFARLRQGGGMSGYPNRSESEHDIVENSHASTALSYAYGLATARRLRRDPRRVVAVVGDGALTGGVAYEALNNIGVSGANVVIVLNDNGRSYAPTVSRISSAAGSVIATGPTPRRSATRDFFEALGVRYLGPVDGHDLDALERALRGVAQLPGPAVLHVHTTKGRGYGPAELDEEKRLHDVGPFDPETGIALAAGGRRLSYTEAFSSAIVREAARRPEVVAITAAMPGPTGLLEFRDRYPERFFDVGIAEQHAVNAAAGMAMGGLRPVVAIYSTFLNRAWDQIYYDVGLHRLPVVFCLDRAGITGDDGPSHHGVLDLMLLTKVPGMTVFAPSSYEEVGNMLHEALTITSGPVAIRWPKSAACPAELVGSGVRARRVRAGSQVCLIGVGKLVGACEQAAYILAGEGINATVWDARVASPLDPVMLEDASAHGLVVSAEDGILEGGVGSRLGAALRGSAPPGAGPVVVNCGVPTAYLPHGEAADILTYLGLDGPGLSRAVLEHQ